MKRIAYTLAIGLLITGASNAQNGTGGPGDEAYGPQPTGTAKAAEQYAANKKKYKDNADILVLPGLVADRKKRQVEVLAESTGLAAREPVEFLLIDKDSSHGYEAMLWSHAKPSVVHQALEFIGLKSGAPFDPRMTRFWADGDRVILEVRDEQGGTAPIEALILDTETDTTLPEEGFVFAGSMKIKIPNSDGKMGYAADLYDPRSVATIYNEPAAVLDVPRQVNQGEAYGKQVANPEAGFRHGQLITIVMTPADPVGRPAARRLVFNVKPVPQIGFSFKLSETNGTKIVEGPEMTPVLEKLVAIRDESVPPYITLTFDAELPVIVAQKVCEVMAMMEPMGVTRVIPPPEGQLYFRAFVPNKTWLNVENRPTQPWELHLAQKGGKVAAEMVWNEPIWTKGEIKPTYKKHAVAIATPKAVRDTLDKHEKERKEAGKRAAPKALLVFVSPRLSYGDVMKFIKPALSTHETVYVFAEAAQQ